MDTRDCGQTNCNAYSVGCSWVDCPARKAPRFEAITDLTLDSLRYQRDTLERLEAESLKAAISAWTFGDDAEACRCLETRRTCRESLANVRAKIAQIEKVC